MILESADDLEVVGEAADGAEVVTAVQRHHPDVVLMDIQAVRVVAAGEAMLSPGVTRRLITHFAHDPRTERRRLAQARLTGVTEREREVLTEVGKGVSNNEIGASRYLSEATVKAHLLRLLVKLDAANRVQVAILAHEAGLLD